MGTDRTNPRRFFIGLSFLLVAPLLRVFPQTDHPWRIELVGKKEPGKRLIIAGTIYQPDGRTPAPNVRMFLYQTDSAGWYSQPVNNPRQPRLHGTLWTDSAGRYEFLTIEPGHYANAHPPPAEHIHMHLEPPNLPAHWLESFKFDGDAYLTKDEIKKNEGLGTFAWIVRPIKGKDGMWHARRDFRIDPQLAERNRLENGWYRQ